MKRWLKIATIVIVVILSIAAGIPKVMQLPQELEFLQAIGFGPIVVSLLGIIQIVGGLLLACRKWRFAGAVITATAFLVSAVALFAGGNTLFGTISILPVLVAGYFAVDSHLVA